MLTDIQEVIAKSARLFRVCSVLSIILVCGFPAQGFASDNRDSISSSSSSKAAVTENDEVETSENQEQDSHLREVAENQTARTEKYKQAWDDAMVAAPAFGD